MLSILHCLCLQHQSSRSLRELIICLYGLQTSALGACIAGAITRYIVWESSRARSVSVCAQGCRNNVGLQLSPVCMSTSSSWLELSPQLGPSAAPSPLPETAAACHNQPLVGQCAPLFKWMLCISWGWQGNEVLLHACHATALTVSATWKWVKFCSDPSLLTCQNNCWKHCIQIRMLLLSLPLAIVGTKKSNI